MSVEFVCQGCGTPTVLTDAVEPPPCEICIMCSLWGVNWQDDPEAVAALERVQRGKSWEEPPTTRH